MAIEADVTSRTTLDAYAALQVPEVWIYDRGQLTIYQLQAESYVDSPNSLAFPNWPIRDVIPQLVEQAFQRGTSVMLRELRQQLTFYSLQPSHSLSSGH
ncbi:hypothetical protein XM38_034410 [Halomicronema hongdechloris C2206]|uniref:Uncharacterized protein n=1 Tax=Halomicronema hongdechloris C2206 TaxID=1641165 RepID=A0A1Z3HQ91_9CYAN|nr:Uma2 family endonuclease [Halomicronema hongdechloris]ASC72484.1 hypothetical protein XM38_034410 [Halomicronema hongdechloris C2206]